MKDMIDERNFRERSSRSIVKGYNVHYMTQEELAMQQQQEEEPKETQEPEKEEALTPEEWADAPSVHYGENKPTDPVTQEQIAKILGEREEQYMSMLHEELDKQE